MLVAADTFRAAAIEQLMRWSERVGADLIKQSSGSDPAAVVYDALTAAQARGVDLVLIDTAGRLHTKVNLMEELKKVKRVIARQIDSAPHEVLLILDATTGQNAISQTRLFHQELGVSGLVLTKLDGTAKGGIVAGVCQEFQIPIRFIGLGEGLDDLKEFEPEQFVEALF
jgi:fused signal recognition particle receptor